MAACRFTPDAVDDIDAIWSFIAQDNPEAAYSVEEEIAAACAWLAERPLRGHVRRDLTKLPVRFWTLPQYPNYIIIYRPETQPLEIIRVLHGMRDIKRILSGQRP
jgi:antitoxin ParD1/3/4